MKRVITIILLLFVVVSIGMIIKKESNRSDVAKDDAMENKTIVYYFHGTKRCVTCNKIEALTQKAVEETFPDEIKRGKMEIRGVNVENPENEHFVQDFQLSMKTVVVAKYDNGEIKDWKKCDKVWNLVNSPTDFKKYIVTRTNAIREG